MFCYLWTFCLVFTSHHGMQYCWFFMLGHGFFHYFHCHFCTAHNCFSQIRRVCFCFDWVVCYIIYKYNSCNFPLLTAVQQFWYSKTMLAIVTHSDQSFIQLLKMILFHFWSCILVWPVLVSFGTQISISFQGKWFVRYIEWQQMEFWFNFTKQVCIRLK